MTARSPANLDLDLSADKCWQPLMDTSRRLFQTEDHRMTSLYHVRDRSDR